MRALLARKPVATFNISYASNNVSVGSWLQITASIPHSASQIAIFDSSGSALQMSIGTAGHETDTGKLIPCVIFPGGLGLTPIELPKGVPFTVSPIDLNATTGEIIVNLYG